MQSTIFPCSSQSFELNRVNGREAHWAVQDTSNSKHAARSVHSAAKKFFAAWIVLILISCALLIQAYAISPSVVQSFSITSAEQNQQTSVHAQIDVHYGDSLWSIAESHVASGQDIRDYVASLIKLNGLASSEIHAGQRLILPLDPK